MNRVVFFMYLLLSCTLFSLEIVPVPKGPQPNFVRVQIVIPEEGKVFMGQPGKIEVRLRGYTLGDMTNMPRGDEISSAKNKASLRVVVDNNPFYIFDGIGVDPFDQEDFDESEEYYLIKIPFSLSEGLHVLRIFPARSYGEGLKMEDNFALSYFYVNKKTDSVAFLKKPFLTYNEPSGKIYLEKDKPVLLDFYVNNCELASNGYKIELIIDGKKQKMITQETPYYIYGLAPGKHQVMMRLMDEGGKFVEGPFNEVKRSFVLE